MDDLAFLLARQARQLGLDAHNVSGADRETLLALVQPLLEELFARGLIEGRTAPDCWAQPRTPLS